MELYILDSLLRRERVVDRFESLIWTERYADVGEFELVVHSTPENRTMFVSGVQLAMNRSYRVMTVETIESKTDSEGRALLTVKGVSLEAILDQRVVKKTMSSITTEPKWTLTGKPADVARQMFDHVCRSGNLNIGDKIPFLMPGTIFPEHSIPEPFDSITWDQEPDSLLSAVKKICEMYDLGFRLVRNFDASQLYFDIYTGSDRTSSQNTLNPVIFSPELDNLQNTTELTTIEESKNVAYVFSSQGFVIVYGDMVDPEVEGFERRVMMVNADDLENNADGTAPTAAQITAYLTQRGREELNQKRSWSAFDGELNQNSAYKYEIDYFLGDLVDMRNVDGVVNKMRVTEQIFVCDREGERAYPTLAIKLFVTPGSWMSWNNNRVWADFGLTEYWADQE